MFAGKSDNIRHEGKGRAVMSIYEAIFNRYSVREYRMEKIEPERLEALKRYLKTVAPLDEEKPVEFEIVDNIDKKQKVHGLWKTEAPYYLAVYCGDDRLSMRNAGYTAEQAVLYLTSKELGTCYLGATKAGEDKKDGLKPSFLSSPAFVAPR